MEKLIEKSIKKISETNYVFERFLMQKRNWKHRLISILGARGAGKTTLVLQFLNKSKLSDNEKVYILLDDIYFSQIKLVDFASYFVKMGGKLLVIDEVHKYPNWSIEIKNIYDDYHNLKVIFTGSSILELNKGEGDLSRRAVSYELPTMSLREFVNFEENFNISHFTLDEILTNHIEIAKEINKKIKPLLFFKKFLRFGAYPFYAETGEEFSNQLMKTINTILETDFCAVIKISYSHIIKLKKLLLLIAENVPFKPNITELSSKVGITRDTVLNYLIYLPKFNAIFIHYFLKY